MSILTIIIFTISSLAILGSAIFACYWIAQAEKNNSKLKKKMNVK